MPTGRGCTDAVADYGRVVVMANEYAVLALLVPILLWVLGFLLLYWVIRLAVRHGTLDAWRRRPDGPQSPGGSTGSS